MHHTGLDKIHAQSEDDENLLHPFLGYMELG